MTKAPIVILGAGHAGTQLAAALRDEGYDGAISLINGEIVLPYQRPPLSKGYLKGEVPEATLSLRSLSFFESKRIDVVNEIATSVNLAARRVVLGSGIAISYSHLVFATGSRPRRLDFPGRHLKGVGLLRDIRDASDLRDRLSSCRSALVIGAGFIGLEFAATARAKGIKVDVTDLAERPMARALSIRMSEYFRLAHEKSGCRFHFGARLRELRGSNGQVTEAALADGQTLSTDLVLLAVGVQAEDQLARQAGLDCDDGILVDERLAASNPNVSAIGDCARRPDYFAGASIRLESVQNAIDQAKYVARYLTGYSSPYRATPWFWSDQGDSKLQIAGLAQGCNEFLLHGDPNLRSFSVLGFRDGRLRCVESVNSPADHMAARRIFDANGIVTPAQGSDVAFDLKHAAKAALRRDRSEAN